ncbi:MAG: hypothetical protein IPM82_25255 [Saprospiraceae bacterium]|nr:hypothetical protein [Saprospiraceae bacterium]
MAEYKGSLYIGGSFGPEMFSLTKSRYIARWDGSNYYGLSEEEPCCINDMVVFHDELYALCAFGQDSEIGATNIAKWDGTKWCSLGSLFNAQAYDLEVYNDTLYVAGTFWKINGNTIRGIAKWTGGDFVAACTEPLSNSELLPDPATQNDILLTPNPVQHHSQLFLPSSFSKSSLSVYNLQIPYVTIPGN